MIDLWMVALLHTVGSVGVFGALAIDAYVRQRNAVAAFMRLILCGFFLRLAGTLWYTAGYGENWLAWTAESETLFVSAAVLYVAFYIADRHRWWNVKAAP